MKSIIRPFGIIAFWLTWPALIGYMRLAERTRVLVVAGEKVLLVNNWYGDGTWSMPGGGKHRREEPVMAATRELHEEVDVALGIDQLKLLHKKRYHAKGFRYDCHYYVAELQKPIILRPRFPEVLNAEWVPIRELDHYNLAPDVMPALSARSALLQ